MEQFKNRQSELEKLTFKKFDQIGSLERGKTDFLPIIKANVRSG